MERPSPLHIQKKGHVLVLIRKQNSAKYIVIGADLTANIGMDAYE